MITPELETFLLYGAIGLTGFVAGGLISFAALSPAKRALARRLVQLESDRHSLNLELNAAHHKLSAETEQRARAEHQYELAQQALLDMREQRHSVERELRVDQARAEERERGLRQQLAQIEEQRERLKAEFSVLANKIFEEKGRSFSEVSRRQLEAQLTPFREQIEGFQKRINDVHQQQVMGNTRLESQIKQVLEVGLKMGDEAKLLATALKGDKKVQGTWSEVQAELLLEMSGLSEGREFRRESSFKNEEGREQRPDFIVNLPNNKHIIIDSKISLNAYAQAVAATTEEERLLHLRAHADSIRQHVKSLSEKNYAQLKGINSPEYIFMFIGNEPAYLAAAEFDSQLFHEAYRKGVAIVTPNTLLSSLRIVAHLWAIDKQTSSTRQLAEQAAKVYDKLRVFSEKMMRLGNQIATVQKTYDESWNTLKDGRGSLAKQVDKFVDMGVSVKERLSADLIDDGVADDLDEPAHLK